MKILLSLCPFGKCLSTSRRNFFPFGVGTVRWVKPDDISLSVGLAIGVVFYGWLVLDLIVESIGFKSFVVVRGCSVENFFRGGYLANSFSDVLWALFDYTRWVVGVSVDVLWMVVWFSVRSIRGFVKVQRDV